MAIPSLTWSDSGTLAAAGRWTADHAHDLEALIAGVKGAARQPVAIDCSALEQVDTLGAYLLHKLRSALGDGAELQSLLPDYATLVREVSDASPPRPRRADMGGAFHLLGDVGETIVTVWQDFVAGVAFFGAVIVAFGKLFIRRARLRPASVVSQLERVALRGVPIVMLISFLVGAIIAQQSIFQLQSFGTTQFVADLIGVLVLRELAVLLTAIMIAGRSGSAFTAELGSMKMREEVDALETMGLDPVEVLVLPRILALIIGLPLLTFLSSVAAIGGGALVAHVYGDVSYDVFFNRLQNIIGMNTFLVGMIKAPFMALIIGLVACIEGFAVRGSAESLGKHVTSSVVKAIFMVIVLDGLFAMFFASIRY